MIAHLRRLLDGLTGLLVSGILGAHPARPRSPSARARACVALSVALALGALTQAVPAQAAGVIYVVPGGTGDGSSWANASDLSPALAAATSGDELWVAAGRYTPTAGTDRQVAFAIKPGVALYGGFAGGETSREQRDWRTYVTTLSGDLLGDDGPDFANTADNSYHVVTGDPSRGTHGAFLVDGVVISGGNANDGQNVSFNRGGGLYVTRPDITLANVTFSANQAAYGGAIYSLWGALTFTNVVFSGNRATSGGGAVFNEGNLATMTNVVFRGNSAAGYSYGGALYENGAISTFTNVVFSGNRGGTGGAISTMNGRQTLTNVTISGNSAPYGGGALYVFNGEQRLRNSIIWGPGDTIFQDTTIRPNLLAITHSVVQGGFEGVGNLSADPRFVSPPSSAPSTSGDLRLTIISPAINAGDNTGVSTSDLDGNPRIIGGLVDMGAYEHPAGVSEAFPVVQSIALAGPNPTSAATVDFTITFDLPVTGVDAGDFVLRTGGQNGAQIVDVQGSGRVWTVTVTTVPDSVGGLRIDVRDDDTILGGSGRPLGGAGLGNGDVVGPIYGIDREAPNTSLGGAPGTPTASTAATFTLSGSDGEGSGVAGFECRLDDGPFASCTSPLRLSDLAEGSHTLQVRAVDAVGNADPSPATVTWVVDVTPPAVSIGAPSPLQTRNGPVSFTVSYAGAETISLSPGDVTLIATGSATGMVTVSGTGASRTVTIADVSGEGTLRIGVGAGTASDAAGNLAGAAGPSGAAGIDAIPPQLALGAIAPITAANAASYPISGACTAGDGAVSVGVGSVSVTAQCVAGSFSAGPDVRGLEDGPVVAITAAQTDGAGNQGAATSGVIKDTGSPSVALRAATAEPTNRTSIPVSVTFSEAVSGLTRDDLVAVNATVGPLSGGGGVYSFELRPLASGPVSVSLAAGAAADAVGNPSATQTLVRTYDGTPPAALGLSIDAPPALGAASFAFTIVLSDNLGLEPASLGDGDVVVRGPGGYSAAGALVAVAPGDAGTTLVTVRIAAPGGRWSPAANGTYSVSLVEGAVGDRAGNWAAATTVGSFRVALGEHIWLPLLRGSSPR